MRFLVYHSWTPHRQMTKEIHKAVPGLASAMNSLDIATLASGMNQFERLFEDLVSGPNCRNLSILL